MTILNNTSGNPPRDAAKIVRTTIYRVSVGVLRIKFHLVYCFVWVPSKTLKRLPWHISFMWLFVSHFSGSQDVSWKNLATELTSAESFGFS